MPKKISYTGVGGYVRPRETKSGIVTYQVAVYNGRDPFGKCRYKYYTAPTEEEAQELLERKKAELILRGNTKPTSSMKVRDFIEQVYMPEYVHGVVKPSTERAYTQLCKYIFPILGDMKLEDIRNMHLQNFYKQLLNKSPLSNKGLTLRTVTDVKRFCSVWLNIAVANGLIETNPNEGIKLPKKIVVEETEEPGIYTPDEISQLLQGASGNLKLYLVLLVDSGIRRGELASLQYTDINWEKHEIFIHRNLTEGLNNTFYTVTPKSKSGIRRIKLSNYTMQLLEESFRQYKKARFANRNFIDSGLIVHKKDGSGMRPKSIYQMYRRECKKLGIRQLPLHSLRALSITYALDNGAPLKSVSIRAGHSSTGITADVYQKCTEQAINETAEIMEGILQQALEAPKPKLIAEPQKIINQAVI